MEPIDDEGALRHAWANMADRCDEPAVVAALLADLSDEGVHAHRARALLETGRPDDALALLPTASREEVIAGRVERWTDLVATACWAARGDDQALGALMREGAGLTDAAAQAHAYLLGSAAEQAGHGEIADRAWRQVFDSGVRTDRVLARVMAVEVGHRDRQDPAGAAADVLTIAQAMLSPHGTGPAEAPLLPTVLDLLAARGDRAGAALLTRALRSLRPRSERLTAIERVHAVRRNPWVEHGLRVLGVVVGAVLLSLGISGHGPAHLTVAGFAIAAGAALHRLPTARGLSRTDDGALRRLGRMGPAREPLPPWFARVPWNLVLVVGVVTCVLVPATVVTAIAGLLVAGDGRSGSDLASAVTWGVTLVLSIVLVAAMLRLPRLVLGHHAERSRAAAHARSKETAHECRCWSDGALTRPLADEYATKHLTPVLPDTPDSTAARCAGLVEEAGAAQCPLTGTRWLVLHGEGGEARLALRGPARVTSSPGVPEQAVGGYL